MKGLKMSKTKLVAITSGALILLILLVFLSYFFIIPLISSEVGDADLSEVVIIKSQEMDSVNAIDTLRQDIESLTEEDEESQGDQNE